MERDIVVECYKDRGSILSCDRMLGEQRDKDR